MSLVDGVAEDESVVRSSRLASDAASVAARDAATGFTLIELMAVIVIIGILATIVILRLAPLKDKAYATSLVEDLRNLETAEEAYFIEYATYTPSLPSDRYMPSTGNTYVVTAATVTGWSAVVSTTQAMVSTASSCHIASGSAETTNGEYPGTAYCP
jgi:prepilin-type N-terminal cleavage/methylation domain-containing protein